MELTLKRKWFNDKCTIGQLFIDGAYECFTLEDKIREIEGQPVEKWKIKGATAIPYGRYEVTITFSQRFGRALPLLLNVNGFDGIRIHPGNTDADTEGCILVGSSRGNESISNSRETFSLLFLELSRAIQKGKIYITIIKEDGVLSANKLG